MIGSARRGRSHDRGRSALRWSAGLVWQADARGALIAGVLQLSGVAASLGVVGASKLAFDALLGTGDSLTTGLVLGLVSLAVATAVSGTVSVLQAQQQRLLGEKTAQLMWRRMLSATALAPLTVWEDSAWIERLDRVRGNALDRPIVVVSSLLVFFGGLTGVAGLGVVLTAIHPILLPTFVVAGLPAVAIGRIAARTEYTFAVASARQVLRRNYLKRILTERRTAAELRTLGAAGFLLRRHATADEEYLGLLQAQVRRRQGYGLATILSSAIALSATLVVIVLLVSRGSISLADAGAAAIGARLLGTQLGGIFQAASSFSESIPFLRDMRSFFEEQPAEAPIAQARPLKRGIRLDQVSFAYPDGRRPALDGVTMEIPAGRVTAIVGENGSGKTTLAKVVAGLYPPDDGEVSWDDDASVSASDFCRNVSLLPQDFARFDMTVMDNIVIADEERASDLEAVHGVARKVGLHDAIEALPSGYETELGIELARGSDLSGGQWQRLALARSLFADAPVLILDEPTSAMDPRAEFELFSDVRKLLEGRTALLITHRYSSARVADGIIVMRDGHVAEAGTHDELMSAAGLYAELYTLQMKAYGMEQPESSGPDA